MLARIKADCAKSFDITMKFFLDHQMPNWYTFYSNRRCVLYRNVQYVYGSKIHRLRLIFFNQLYEQAFVYFLNATSIKTHLLVQSCSKNESLSNYGKLTDL